MGVMMIEGQLMMELWESGCPVLSWNSEGCHLAILAGTGSVHDEARLAVERRRLQLYYTGQEEAPC